MVSTVDPDGLINREGLGGIGTSASGIATLLSNFATDPELWRQASANAREYFLRHHQIDEAMTCFQAMFYEMSQDNVAAGGAPLDRPA